MKKIFFSYYAIRFSLFAIMFLPTYLQVEAAIKKYGTPLFVTDAATIRTQAEYLQKSFSSLNTKIFYAIKANYNPHIVNIIKDAGIYGVDAVSPNEVRLALELGYTPEQIIFTPSNPSDEELQYVGEKKVLPNLGSISEVERFGKLFPEAEISIRICPEVGEGECDKMTTGQQMTKFGIMIEDISEVKKVCEKYGLKMRGIHSHIGSGFYKTEDFTKSVVAVCDVAKNFEHIQFLDFGGGFGVNYTIGKSDINLSHFAEKIEPIIRKFEEENGKKIEIRIEPGKFLVSASTIFLMKVTTIKEKSGDIFVGCDAGFGQYIRPAMYGAFQDFVNLSNPNGAKKFVRIAGNVCETCDLFNEGIKIAEPREGDILAMVVAGGYGSAMASNYNLRERCAEVLLDNGEIKLIRKRESFEEIMKSFDIS